MDGLMVDDSQPLNGTWAGLQAGLRPGDQLLDLTDANGNTTQFSTASDDSMSGMGGMGSLTGQAATNQLNQVLANLSRGQIITIDIARSGSAKVYSPACTIFTATGQQCTYSVVLAQLPFLDFLWHFGVSFAVGAVFLAIALVVLLRRHQSLAGRWLSSACSFAAILIVGHFDMMSTHQGGLLWIVSACALR